LVVKRDVLDTRNVGEIADQIRQIGAQQRLAAGEPQLAHAEPCEQARQARNLIERQAFVRLQEAVIVVELFLRHAIGAAKIAAIHDGDPQIVQRPCEAIEWMAAPRMS
jgi:hypothetical protein